MFDIGATELLLVAVIGLIVFGPKRLPEAARKATQYYKQWRNIISKLKTEAETALLDDKDKDSTSKPS